MNNADIKLIQESFLEVYGPIAKAIGDCLLAIKSKKINATAVISAILAVGIDIAAKANKLAKEEGHISISIDTDHLTRFVAICILTNLNPSTEVRAALEKLALAGLSPKKPTAPGSDQLN